MSLKSFAFVALFATSTVGMAGPAAAQGRISDVPANIPPASFTGKQFVDNNGCVFVRAGFDGNVTWVPRVSRNRQAICGQTPTFGRTAAAPASSVPQTRSAPEQITVAPAPAAAASPAPSATARATTAAPAAAASTASTATATARRTPAATRTATRTPARRVTPSVTQPRTMRAPASKPVAAPPPRIVHKAPVVQPAPGASQAMPEGARIPAYVAHPCANGGTAATRTVGKKTLSLRCGPQQAPYVTVIRRGEQPGSGTRTWQGSLLALPGETRIIPRHVYAERALESDVTVPQGYRPAWEDDRLNPHRALQTVDGYNATRKVWTNTVPRESIATANAPETGTATIVGRVTAHRPVILSTQGNTKAARKPVVSSRSTPKTAVQFVKVGAFTTRAKADAAATRLRGAGLPVRYGTGNGMTYVLVGPYASDTAAQAGLRRTHATGYVQATLR